MRGSNSNHGHRQNSFCMRCMAPEIIMMTISALWSRQDGTPLPPSLVRLCLESGYPIDLGELAQGEERLTAAAAATLVVRSEVICCSLEWMTGGAESRAVRDTATALHVERLVSKLPAGFAALEMCEMRMTVNCSTAVHLPTPEATALELCLSSAHAPATYRRFTLLWQDNLLLFVDMTWPLGFAEPALQPRVTFNSATALAEHLQNCAATLNMSVALHAAPATHVVITRL